MRLLFPVLDLFRAALHDRPPKSNTKKQQPNSQIELTKSVAAKTMSSTEKLEMAKQQWVSSNKITTRNSEILKNTAATYIVTGLALTILGIFAPVTAIALTAAATLAVLGVTIYFLIENSKEEANQSKIKSELLTLSKELEAQGINPNSISA